MKLDENQIDTIDRVLEKLGVVYIDYKHEILDHIAAEVEEEMLANEIDFDTAFLIVLEKWQPKLQKSSSTWFGYFWEMPEILMQKCIKIHKKNLLEILFGATIITLVVLLFSTFITNHIEFFLNILTFIFIANMILLIVGYVKIRLSKIKTSYGFLFKQASVGTQFLYLQQLFFLTTSDPDFEVLDPFQIVLIFIFSVLILIPVINLKNYKSHFRQLEKMSSIKA